jgi:hypothetical protein
MATNIQEAFDKSVAELGFDSLFDEPSISLEGIEEQEQPEEPEAGATGEDVGEDEVASEDEALVDEVEESDDDDADAEDTSYVDIAEDAKLRLPDGTVVDASQAILLQADYTRKTQELSEQRKKVDAEKQQVERAAAQYEQAYSQMRDWYESRAAQPSDWLAEIASQSSDPTATVAQAIYTMAQNNLLDPKFVETFGIDASQFEETAKSSQVKNELEELKRWRQEQETTAQRQAQVRERAAVYEREWESIKTSQSIKFEDKAQELEAKRELLQFALENNLTRSLTDAYDLMTVRKPKSVNARPQPDAEVAAKKRASRAVSAKSAGGTAPRAKKNLTTRDAILQSMQEIAGA